MTAPTAIPFPQAVDSSLVAAFRSCPQKAFRSYFEHWKPQRESVHLVAGGAYARGLEVARKAYFDDGAEAPEAEAAGLEALITDYGEFECPPDSAKSLERTAGALEFYFSCYPLATDEARPIKLATGKHAIEFLFAEPLPVLHPVTGNPIIYTGRSDQIAEWASAIYVHDDKTTSSLGPSWSKQWDLRSQFTGYNWAARKIGLDTKGTLVRGVSILKTKYDTQQALPGCAPWEIDRWEQQVCRDVERMIECWKSGYWDWNLDNACAEYGGCAFQQVCKSPDPEAWLPMYFERRVWDPMTRKEHTIEEWGALQQLPAASVTNVISSI